MGSCSSDATPLAESGSEQVSASIQRIATRRTLAAMPTSVAKESFIVLKVRLAGELDRPVAALGRRASRRHSECHCSKRCIYEYLFHTCCPLYFYGVGRGCGVGRGLGD